MTTKTCYYRILLFVLALVQLHGQVWGQNEEPKKWQLTGYVKDLVTISIRSDSTLVDNLVHNRLNFKWFINDNFTAKIEIRNRLFHGDLVRTIPDYGSFVDVNNDHFDFSFMVPENKSWLFHTMVDRAYVEWYKDEWEIRAGRQRINWGINVAWNPNDLFNAYSFFDFDYEERPGSDAVRIRKYIGYAGSLEVAANISDDFDKTVVAGMYKLNKWDYDMQFIIGKAREDLAIGVGWVGNIGNAGFKGEMTYFNPYKNENLEKEAFLISTSFDYSFESSLYLNGSVLYNSGGTDNPNISEINLNSSGSLTARDLSPFKLSTFVQVSYSFHPLLGGGLATIYYPGQRNTLFFNPNITYSIKPNLDLALIGQILFDKVVGNYQSEAGLLYARVKWSF